jgi:hypothetical protein
VAAAAAVVLLAGCETARVAAPDVRPSPAQNAAAAAAALGVGSRADVVRAQAELSAHVPGWQEPATAKAGETEVRVDAETAARVERLQAQARAFVAPTLDAAAEPR